MIEANCSICQRPLLRKRKRLKGYKCLKCVEASRDKKARTEYLRSWRQNNPKKFKASSQKAIEKYLKTAKAKRTRAAYEAYRRACIKQATPQWADLDAIREFYQNCPEGCEVDHIVPLQHSKVCGLHVLENLQYLTMRENRCKRNKWEVA